MNAETRAYVAAAVEMAPPLTPRQVEILAAAFSGAVNKGEAPECAVSGAPSTDSQE